MQLKPFRLSLLGLSLLIPLALAAVVLFLLIFSAQAIGFNGFGFVTRLIWDLGDLYSDPVTVRGVLVPNGANYGIAVFVVGTLLSSAIAILIAVPLSVGAAIFLSEAVPGKIRPALSMLVELVAVVPSVVFGLWGIAVLVPFIGTVLGPVISKYLGFIPFLAGGDSGGGYGLLAASVVLALMITPIIATTLLDALLQVPKENRESAFALGATHFEVVSKAMMPMVRTTLIGGIVLALGRALGGDHGGADGLRRRPQHPAAFDFQPDFHHRLLHRQPARQRRGRSHQYGGAQPGGNRAGAVHHHAADQCGGQNSGLRGYPCRQAQVAPCGRAAPARMRRQSRSAAPRSCGASSAARSAGSPAAWRLALVIGPLLDIVWVVAYNGASAFSPKLFTSSTPPAGVGLWNAIEGTFVISFLAMAVAVPIGVGAGIYLSEYGNNKLGNTIRFLSDVLTGTPSIVLGYFSYIVLVGGLGWGLAAPAGAVTIAILVVPYLARITELALRQVPVAMREAGFALGASEPTVVFKIVLPGALSGVLTGALLALAISVGETAPLIYTAGFSSPTR